MKLIRTEDAVGHVLCHDMTQIIPGEFKGARFRKGHIVTEEDIPVMLSMGKENLYVWEKTEGMLHEDEAALRLRDLCVSEYMHCTDVKEGKVELIADADGLFEVDTERLYAVNDQEELMIATRHTNTAVHPGDKLAGMRVSPLVIEEEKLKKAEEAAGKEALLRIRPWKLKTAAIISSSLLLTAYSLSVSTSNRPSASAMSSTLPSFTGVQRMCSLMHRSRSRRAASSS